MSPWGGIPLPVLPGPARREHLRKAMGITVNDAAAMLKVTRVSFHNWECGKTSPQPDNHRKYAALLKEWQAACDSRDNR